MGYVSSPEGTTSFWVPFQVPDQFVFLKSWPSIYFVVDSGSPNCWDFVLLKSVPSLEFDSISDLLGKKTTAKKLTQKKTCKPCNQRNSTGDSNSQKSSSNRKSLNVIKSQSKQLIINNHRFVCLFVCSLACLLACWFVGERCKKTRCSLNMSAWWLSYFIQPPPNSYKISSIILKRFINFYWETLQKKTTLKIPPPFREESQQPNRGKCTSPPMA